MTNKVGGEGRAMVITAQRIADWPAFLVAVLAHTPAARNQVHRQ